MENKTVISQTKLQNQWPMDSPFLFCAHHLDHFPGGDENMEPLQPLHGRNIGSDFSGLNGWSMYHGSKKPGFPAHPHRGFETLTIARRGYIDHLDGLGGQGRFGQGDAQWMTAGRGLQHSEMFPLVNEDKNTTELFQIWINLAASDKLVEPYYNMFWIEDIPEKKFGHNNASSITLYAGEYEGLKALNPNPNSWAARPENLVQVWFIDLEQGDTIHIPETEMGINRSVYFYEGTEIEIDSTNYSSGQKLKLNPLNQLSVKSVKGKNKMLFMQGKPILESVVQYGPFVMNSKSEIIDAINEFNENGYGGWPFESREQCHPRSAKRFAIYADGSKQERELIN